MELNSQSLVFFDHIICEHPLPLPDEEELKSMDWDDFSFICDKLSNLSEEVEEYQIGDNGLIYKKEILDKEKGHWQISQQEITCEIKFFGLRQGEKYDYSFEFSSLFFKGELKELNLVDFEKVESNSDKLTDKYSAFNPKEECNTWYHTYLVNPVKYVLYFPIYITFIIIHTISVFLLRFLFYLK